MGLVGDQIAERDPDARNRGLVRKRSARTKRDEQQQLCEAEQVVPEALVAQHHSDAVPGYENRRERKERASIRTAGTPARKSSAGSVIACWIVAMIARRGWGGMSGPLRLSPTAEVGSGAGKQTPCLQRGRLFTNERHPAVPGGFGVARSLVLDDQLFGDSREQLDAGLLLTSLNRAPPR